EAPATLESPPACAVVELRSPTATPDTLPTHHSPTHQPPAASAAAVHNLHNENPPQIAASRTEPCTCTLEIRVDKNSTPCITSLRTPTRRVSEEIVSELTEQRLATRCDV